MVEYLGVKFYGAPWVPELRGQAFYKDDVDLGLAWAQIPTDLDVLNTHTPPSGVLDVSSRGLKLGCEHLSAELKKGLQYSTALAMFMQVLASRRPAILPISMQPK
jgi:hypothetical protein